MLMMMIGVAKVDYNFDPPIIAKARVSSVESTMHEILVALLGPCYPKLAKHCTNM